jgi:hypothetical protein
VPGHEGRFVTAEVAGLVRVEDNVTFHDITENVSLRSGTGFKIVTDIETGRPNGTLFVVSIDKGSIYEIRRR